MSNLTSLPTSYEQALVPAPTGLSPDRGEGIIQGGNGSAINAAKGLPVYFNKKDGTKIHGILQNTSGRKAKILTPQGVIWEIMPWSRVVRAAPTDNDLCRAKVAAGLDVGVAVDFQAKGERITGIVHSLKAGMAKVDVGNRRWTLAASLLTVAAVQPDRSGDPLMAQWEVVGFKQGLMGLEGRSWEAIIVRCGARVLRVYDDASGGPVAFEPLCKHDSRPALEADAKAWALARGGEGKHECAATWVDWMLNERLQGIRPEKMFTDRRAQFAQWDAERAAK